MMPETEYSRLADEDVMRSFQTSRDERAFNVLYKRYYHPLYKFILWMASDENIAKDVAQETLIKVFQKPELFNAHSGFKTWLYTIAKNTLKNVYRKDANERNMKDTLQVVRDEDLPTDSDWRTDKLKQIERAVQRLPEKQRETFVMKYSSNLTIAEISEICDCSVGTIKSRLFHATHAIKEKLEVKR